MTERKTKEGIIKVVAKTGGIILDGDEAWYNPTNTAKAYVKPEMKGQAVKLSLVDDDDHKFSFISQIKKENVPATPTANGTAISKDDYWKRKEERDKEKQKQISKHGAINTAIEIMRLSAKYGGLSGLNTATDVEQAMKSDKLLQTAETLAEEILKWLNNGD